MSSSSSSTMLPRRTRRSTIAAATLLVAIATASANAVHARDDSQWLLASSSSETRAIGVRGLPQIISLLSVTTSPAPPAATTQPPEPSRPTSPAPETKLPTTAAPTTPPVPTSRTPIPSSVQPVPVSPEPRPPGSPSTPLFDANGASIPNAPRAPSTRADLPPSIPADKGKAKSVPSTPASPGITDGGVPSRNDAPRTKDAMENDAQTGSSSDEIASDYEASASGSTSSSGSASSPPSSISFPPAATLPTAAPVPNTATPATATPVVTRESQSAFHEAAVYIGVLSAIITVLLLAALHVFAFDAPWLNWPHEWLSANGWELLLYVGYLQQLASLSQMELPAMPAFAAQFSDALAWSNFLIQRTELVRAAPPLRRLADTTNATIALDAYGDRIGIGAADLLVNGVVGVVVVLGILCLVFVALLVCGKKTQDDKFDLESSAVSVAAQASNYPTHRHGTLWVLGFGIMLWFVSLYPLTMLATFDLETANANTTLAVVVLVILCGLVLARLAHVVLSKNDEQLMSSSMLKMYGSLYAELAQGFHWFFLATVFTQVTLGVCVGAIREASTQLTVALVIVIGYLVVVLLCSPFTSQTPLLLTIGVCVLKILNYSVAFAFLPNSSVSVAGRKRAGDAIVVISMLVLLLWLARVLCILTTFVRLYGERRSVAAAAETPAFYGARESVKMGMNLDTNPILGGSGVYVTLMMSPPQRLGSEFGGDSFDNGLPRRTGRLAQL